MPWLFSYGTLQQDEVQLATFGRRLVGHRDELVGFEQGLLKVDDAAFVATSGKAHHAIVKSSDDPASVVRGMVFELTDAELLSADAYEPAPYARVGVTLRSGKQAWVYTDPALVRTSS